MVKSGLLGVAGVQLILRVPASVWEWSDAPAFTSVALDGAWVLLLGGLPALIGWPRDKVWQGAAISVVTTLAGSGLWLALHPHLPAEAGVELGLRMVRLGAEGVVVIALLVFTGAWAIIVPDGEG